MMKSMPMKVAVHPRNDRRFLWLFDTFPVALYEAPTSDNISRTIGQYLDQMMRK